MAFKFVPHPPSPLHTHHRRCSRLLLFLHTTYRPGQDDCGHNAVYVLTHSLPKMYHFLLGVPEIPACVLNFPFPLLICPLSCLKGPPSDVVLEPLPTVTPSQLYRVSHVHLPSISSLLNSHPSPSSLTYHPSPSAFSLRIDFKLAERFARVVLRCLSPTSLGFSRSSLLLTRSLLSLLLSCLLLPLGLTLRNINCLPALPSTFVQTPHRHLFPSPRGLSSSRISSFVLGTITS